jgi:nitroimidazol reductase NimA-like FMN-containing flavoprotein (pyridoxamine 5'-phosphate oxidase superfamily)
MDNKPAPVFRDLDRDEIDALLGRNNVGRIAFTFHDFVDIEPINYVYSSPWLYGRTSQGAKLDTITHQSWVAFEADEVTGLFDWQSVVVKGSLEIIDADTWTHHDPGFIRGLELLCSLLPETLRSNDPVPFRHTVFRIHVDEVRGREANSGAVPGTVPLT